MRVIYPYTTMPEHPQIARALREQLGWEPLLWVAPSVQRQQVLSEFPKTVFQTVEDAVYGRPIRGLNTTNPPPLDRTMWESLQSHLPRILSSMDYYGPPNAFLYPERERFARVLLMQWAEILTVLKPDVVLFKEAPHLPHAFAIYSLCQEYQIPTPFFVPTAAHTLALLKDSMDAPPLRIEEAKEQAGGAHDPLEDEVAAAITRVTDGDTFKHEYMEQQAAAEKREGGRARLTPKARRAQVTSWPLRMASLRRLRGDAAKDASAATSEWILLKFPGLPPGEPAYTLGDYSVYRKESADRKALLREAYLRSCTEPRLTGEKYVYFALHYQPERTTSSDGGVFKDQFLAAAMISAALPDGWLLYVKEHPSQFARIMHGDKGRTAEAYGDLAALHNVRLIRPDFSSKELATHAHAVATITGTLGWEGALLGKPSIVFGRPWYEGCPGVVRVGSVDEIRNALADLGQSSADGESIRGYLRALQRSAFRTDINAWQREAPTLSPEEQAAGWVSAMSWWIQSRCSSRQAFRSHEE